MIFKQLRFIQNDQVKLGFKYAYRNVFAFSKFYLQTTKAEGILKQDDILKPAESYVYGVNQDKDQISNEILPSPPVTPMVMSVKEPIVLSFDDVPGPKSLKYLANVRQYFSDIGTQLTASILTFGINLGAYFDTPKSFRTLSRLFDEYGPVVRFVSPVGKDIVLINHPDHIQKVYAMEGEYPVRSALDSLEKYRIERQNYIHGGLYTVHGNEWNRQRTLLFQPLRNAICYNFSTICEICDIFTMKVYNMRNHQDEIPSDLYKEIHKWAFDCMGLMIFGKEFNILKKDEHTQCDMAWLYNSFVNATEAIAKCESGLQLWKIFNTPAWNALVVNCDILNSIIIKHVTESKQFSSVSTINIEQPVDEMRDDQPGIECVINSILMAEKMKAEDVATILMDMLLIGINTINSAMGFLLYNLACSQKCQKLLYKEIEKVTADFTIKDIDDLDRMPYLQACIKETLRLVPPIPVLTRILQKNITLDRYNIPRGTLIIMSTKDSALKEGNYDDATKFCPDRWLKPDAKEYHAFASIPFGFGARKCIGQNVAEVMLSVLTMKLIGKYKMEYHYGDIVPTRGFIAKPNKPLKIRFIDRYKDI